MDAYYRDLLESRKEDKRFREIYERFREQMYRLALSLLEDRNAAAEVTKEAFAALAARLHELGQEDAAALEEILTGHIHAAAAARGAAGDAQ